MWLQKDIFPFLSRAMHHPAIRCLADDGVMDQLFQKVQQGCLDSTVARPDRLILHFQSILAICVQSGDTASAGKYLNIIGWLYFTARKYEKSLSCSRAATAMLENTGALTEHALALYLQGINYSEQDQLHDAEMYLQRALVCFGSLEEDSYENQVLLNLGRVYVRQRKFSFALSCYESVLDSLLRHPDREFTRQMLNEVLSLLMRLCQNLRSGDYAGILYQKALTNRLKSINQVLFSA